MATPLYPLLEKIVDDAWERLDREKITPWFFMTAGPPFKVNDFYGKTISYQGIEFEGSPRLVFWGRYIEPFLEDIVDKVVREALRLATERGQDPRTVLPEAAGLLKSLARRAYARMTEVDRRLRGKGYPESVHPRSAASEQGAMEVFIDRRVGAEVAMSKPRLRINTFYNEHPFLFWLIALLVGAVVTFLAA